MPGLRHNHPGLKTHYHRIEGVGPMAFTFETIDPTTLPKKGTFGRAKLYEDEDVAAAIGILRNGSGISNGKTYESKTKAHNAAGTLRDRIAKTADAPKIAATVVEIDKGADKGKFRFWIVPAS